MDRPEDGVPVLVWVIGCSNPINNYKALYLYVF